MDNPLAGDLDHILRQTNVLWEELRGQRLFITGGTGFFGCWLLESFCWANRILKLGAEAWVLTRDPRGFKAKRPHLACGPGIVLHEGNISSCAFPSGDFPFVIHAAGITRESSVSEMLDTTILGTRRILGFAGQAHTKKFLLTSSGAVYGKQPSEIAQLAEDYRGAPDTMDPRGFYGECKRSAEMLCAAYSKQYAIEMKIARGFAFVGPYLPLDIHFAIGNFIGDSLAGGPITVKGDGTPYRSYLYAADLAIWLWTILLIGKNCRPYNVGSSKEISIKDLADTISRFSTPALPVIMQTEAKPGIPAERYVPNTVRARDELGLTESVSIDNAIKRTIMWNESLRRGKYQQ